jgi:BirA family biotin operon repressor/biotin-[acetyl-CoA-carboxylase] ligase
MASPSATHWTKTTRFVRLHHVTSCASTQDLALADRGADCAVFWADHQARGRGRHGRVWYDEGAQDIAVTFRVIGVTLTRPARLPVVVPCVVLRAVEAVANVRLSFKWPNDVMAQGRKLAGILIDSEPPVYAIGVGLNVNRTAFPDELAHTATSLALACGRTFDRADLIGAMAVELDQAIAALAADRADAWAALFRERLGLVGHDVVAQVAGREHHGRVASIDLDQVTFTDGQCIVLATLQGLRHA